MANVLLLGLDSCLAEDLSRVLRHLGHTVTVSAGLEASLDASNADLVFTDSHELHAALSLHPRLPVIVTSRLPEVAAWLNALEAGAADYCGAPFEPTQVRWVLDTALAA
jgi:DNA-binding NtrC family response regulator